MGKDCKTQEAKKEKSMKLLDKFIYKGVKRVCVGKSLDAFSSIHFVEYVDYGRPMHEQRPVRVFLSDIMGDASTRKDEAQLLTGNAGQPSPAKPYLAVDNLSEEKLARGVV